MEPDLRSAEGARCLSSACPTSWPALLALSLNAYVLFGGADFGGGVWDLLASGPRRNRQREVIAHALGPIWEANHVWLILAIVLTFTCFPPVCARLGTVLHIPLTLMLIGIVLRGSAFTFRTYDSQHDATQRRWGRIFSSASVITPVLLGVSIGAVAAGRVGQDEAGGFVAAVRGAVADTRSRSASGCSRWRSSPFWPRCS